MDVINKKCYIHLSSNKVYAGEIIEDENNEITIQGFEVGYYDDIIYSPELVEFHRKYKEANKQWKDNYTINNDSIWLLEERLDFRRQHLPTHKFHINQISKIELRINDNK